MAQSCGQAQQADDLEFARPRCREAKHASGEGAAQDNTQRPQCKAQATDRSKSASADCRPRTAEIPPPEIHMNSRLYVGNLPPGVTEADLRHLFSRVGGVSEVQLVLDPTTHRSRGQAFVTMATPELAAVARSTLHSYSLGARYIVVTEAGPPQESKGLIGQGFEHAAPSFSRRGGQHNKSRRHSSRFPRKKR